LIAREQVPAASPHPIATTFDEIRLEKNL